MERSDIHDNDIKHRNDSCTPIKLKLATKILTSLLLWQTKERFPLQAGSLLFLQHKIDFRVTGERGSKKKLNILMPRYRESQAFMV